MTTRKASTGECDACRRIIWQAVFTSECGHTFHLRCVSGTAACPVCAARWTDTPATAPAPAPATPFTFASTTDSSSASRPPLFGQPSTAHNSYFTSAWPPPTPMFGQPSPSWTPMFGQSSPSTASHDSFTFAPPPLSPLCTPMFGQTSPSTASLNSVFDDDEPVEPPSSLNQVIQEATTNKDRVLVLKTHCEHPAVARDTALDSFAVLVHAKAPPATAATADELLLVPSLDLVAVLDDSGSMAAGNKLALLKQAMGFVIDRLLGPRDRLSVVALSCEARRVLRLARMSDSGKATAKAVVESLVPQGGGTDIRGGLRVAAEVLDGRRHRNAIAGVILLSDGKDNHAYHHPNCISSMDRYSGLVPRSLRCTFGSLYPPPVHMFGLGTDHDAEAMHAIASVTRGTFSIIDKEAAVQDGLAQCIGGLRSVAVQEARVVVECLHPGVNVRAFKSSGGRYYPSLIDMGGRAASVDVGELRADEERRFLLFLGVPIAATAGDDGAKDGDGGGGSVTRLIKVSCTYKDAATGRSVDVCCEDDAAVQRPVVVPLPATATTDMDQSCVEVARERFRVEAAEDIAAVRDAAGHGEHARAARILDRRQEASAAAGLALAGDDKCAELVAELRGLSARVAADRREYEQTGRASRVPAFGSTPAAGSTFRATATGPSLVSFGPTPAFGSGTSATAMGGYLVSFPPFGGSIVPAAGQPSPAFGS